MTIGKRQFLVVMTLLTAFAVAFVLFEHNHELNDEATSPGVYHYMWWMVAMLVVMAVVMWRYSMRLDRNVRQLKRFADEAAQTQDLEVTNLRHFSDDELGDIAERIVTLYYNLQNSRTEQDRLKRELTQKVAHELKTPAASLQGYVETLLHMGDNMTAQTRHECLERCMAQSMRLTTLLRDISTLHRLDEATLTIKKEPVDVNALVNEIARDTALQFKLKNMAFSINLPGSVIVRGDHDHLYSVFRNLADNAVAYAGSGKVFSITATLCGDQWHFGAEDNGAGVAPEHLPRLFERFYRVDKGRSRALGGTGLGLSIVKNVVLSHGGTITASIAPTGGLRFNFTLPNIPSPTP